MEAILLLRMQTGRRWRFMKSSLREERYYEHSSSYYYFRGRHTAAPALPRRRVACPQAGRQPRGYLPPGTARPELRRVSSGTLSSGAGAGNQCWYVGPGTGVRGFERATRPRQARLQAAIKLLAHHAAREKRETGRAPCPDHHPAFVHRYCLRRLTRWL